MLSQGYKINKNSSPIGYIDGGYNDKQLIFINLPEIDLTRKEREKHEARLKNASKAEAEKLTGKQKIDIYDGIFRQMPQIVLAGEDKGKMIFRHYLAGPSQCGKSTYAASLIKEYKDYNKKNRVIIFSDTKKDAKLDKLNPIRIPLNDELIAVPIDTDELKNSLCVFDDIDSIVNKDIRKAVCALRDQILQKGRHDNISCICTNHQITNYKDTRILLNECQTMTLFPKASGAKAVRYVLENYFGLDKTEIADVLQLPGRWVTIHKENPRWVAYNEGIYML